MLERETSIFDAIFWWNIYIYYIYIYGIYIYIFFFFEKYFISFIGNHSYVWKYTFSFFNIRCRRKLIRSYVDVVVNLKKKKINSPSRSFHNSPTIVNCTKIQIYFTTSLLYFTSKKKTKKKYRSFPKTVPSYFDSVLLLGYYSFRICETIA